MSSNSLCLVSFYIGIKEVEPNHHHHHKLEDYIHSGQLLIDIPIKKVLFVDSTIIHRFTGNIHTTIIPITLDDFTLYKDYYNRCSNGEIKVLTVDKGKDTAMFHLLQLSKSDFVARAIRLNPFNADIFAWVDFGIRKVFRSDDEMRKSIMSLTSQLTKVPKRGLLMAGCWPLNAQDYSEYDRILWYFCGTFFAGYKDTMLKFAELVEAEAMFNMEVLHKLTFEVNIWFRIWRSQQVNSGIYGEKNIEFHWYPADHNARLFQIS